MLVFNCTKAAANFLSPRKSQDSTPLLQAVPEFDIEHIGSSEQPISQWLVQHTKELDQDILYVCHVQHRFTMVFTEIEQGNWLSFMQCFWERLVNHLSWLVDEMPFDVKSTPQDWVDNMRIVHSPRGERAIFCQRYSASVNASVGRFRSHFETALYEIGCLPDNEEAAGFEFEENARIHFSGRRNGMFYPAHELFCECLETYMGVTENELATFKSLSLDYFEKILHDMRSGPNIDPEDSLKVLHSLINNAEVKR